MNKYLIILYLVMLKYQGIVESIEECDNVYTIILMESVRRIDTCTGITEDAPARYRIVLTPRG